MSEPGDKTTDVDPGADKTRDKTLASECEQRTVTEASQAEKRQTGVKKERTSMRRRMKDAALASSRQIRRASNSLTDSAKRISEGFSTFVSRPIKERSLNNFMERVKQRNEARRKASSDSMQLRPSDDAFPTSNSVCADNIADPPGPPTEKSEKSTRSEKSEKVKTKIGNKEADKIFPDLGKKKGKSDSGSKRSKRNFLSNRQRKKKKEADIFKDGKPFWMRAGKITQEEKNEITQDDLPLNAEIIVDVKNGKIDLPVLPNMQFKFDAYAPMETLRSRDKIFFTHKMLFANTIRSMINTTDEAKTDSDLDSNNNTDAERTVERKTECDDGPGRRVKLMPHPKYCTSYDPAMKLQRDKFEYTGKGVV